ncbi:MAG: hypothetical protein AAGI48_17260 [Verrucomicrobiota bacterium]
MILSTPFSPSLASRPIFDRAKDILSHLEPHSAKPDAKKRGPEAKNTCSRGSSNTPHLGLFD